MFIEQIFNIKVVNLEFHLVPGHLLLSSNIEPKEHPPRLEVLAIQTNHFQLKDNQIFTTGNNGDLKGVILNFGS